MSTINWIETCDMGGTYYRSSMVFMRDRFIALSRYSGTSSGFVIGGDFANDWTTSTGPGATKAMAATMYSGGAEWTFALLTNNTLKYTNSHASSGSTITLPVSQTNNAIASHPTSPNAGRCMIVGETNVSIQEGISFTGTTHTLPATASWRAIEATYDGYVTVAYGTNMAATFVIGGSWAASTMPATANWSHMVVHNGKHVFAVADGSTDGAVSTDGGATWTAFVLPASKDWQDILVWNHRLYIFGGTYDSGDDWWLNPVIYSAPLDDLSTWESEPLPTDADFIDCVCVSDLGIVMQFSIDLGGMFPESFIARTEGTPVYTVTPDGSPQSFHVPPFGTVNFAMELASADYPVVLCVKFSVLDNEAFDYTWIFYNNSTTPPTWDTLGTADGEWGWGDVVSDGTAASMGPFETDGDVAASVIVNQLSHSGVVYAVPVQRLGELEIGQEYALPQLAGGTMTHLQVVVPETARFPVTFRLSQDTLPFGDIDLYVELGAEASYSSPYGSWEGGDDAEAVEVTEAGTWHIMIDHYQWSEGRTFVAENGPQFWTGFINCEEP